LTALKELAAKKGAPSYLRMGSVSELVAHALTHWRRPNSTCGIFTRPGCPWQGPWVESSNGRLRDELLGTCQFSSVLEAQVLLEDWRTEHNYDRPNSTLGVLNLNPTKLAKAWADKTNQEMLSLWVDSSMGVRQCAPV